MYYASLPEGIGATVCFNLLVSTPARIRMSPAVHICIDLPVQRDAPLHGTYSECLFATNLGSCPWLCYQGGTRSSDRTYSKRTENPVPIPHTQLAVSGGQVPTEREILKLAEQVSYVFGLSEAAGLKEQLRQDAEVYRDWLHHQQRLKDDAHNLSLGFDEKGRKRVAYGTGTQRSQPGPETLTFLLALLFICPQILSRPAGFEWVLQDLEKVLIARRLDPGTNRMFVKVMNKARTKSRVGPPKDKALEYFRYATINELMNPSVVIPGVKAKKMNKTKAVEYVAAMETRLFNGEGGTRSIWTSHKRVDQFLRQLTDRVQAESSLVPPPTKPLDRDPQEGGRNSKKRMTQAKHRKSPRRT